MVSIAETWEWIKLLFWMSMPLLIPIWLFTWKHFLAKFPIKAEILEKRGDNLIATNDYLGRVEEAGIVKYKFRKGKDTIPIINYDWVLQTAVKPTTILERFVNLLRGVQGTVYIFKYGSKQYKPINVTDKTNEKKMKYVEIKDKDGNPVIITIYEQYDPRTMMGKNIDFEIIDWDNMNFMVQEQRSKIEKWAEKKDWKEKYLIPAMVIAAGVLVFIFASYFATEMWKIGAASKVEAAPAPAATPAKVPIIGDLIPGG